MKIITNISSLQGPNREQTRRTKNSDDQSSSGVEKSSGTSQTFADVVSLTSQIATEPTQIKSPVDVVSLENRRAQAPPKSLEAAEELLNQVTEQIGRSSKTELGRMHRLEGLVHIFQV